MRLSMVGPHELKKATVSAPDVSASGLTTSVTERRVLPDVVAPTARIFFAIAGLEIVHVELTVSPEFPAAKISKFSGFWWPEQKHK